MHQLRKETFNSKSLLHFDLMKKWVEYSSSRCYSFDSILSSTWKTLRGAQNCVDTHVIDLKKRGFSVKFVPTVVEVEIAGNKRFIIRDHQYMIGECVIRRDMCGSWHCQLMNNNGVPAGIDSLKTFKDEDSAASCGANWSYESYLSEQEAKQDRIDAEIAAQKAVRDEKDERESFERESFGGFTIDELLVDAIRKAKKNGDDKLSRKLRNLIFDAEDQIKEALDSGNVDHLDSGLAENFPKAFNAVKKHLSK